MTFITQCGTCYVHSVNSLNHFVLNLEKLALTKQSCAFYDDDDDDDEWRLLTDRTTLIFSAVALFLAMHSGRVHFGYYCNVLPLLMYTVSP